MEIVLRPRSKFDFPIEADCIKPEEFMGKNHREIAGLLLFRSFARLKIGDLFEVEKSGEASEEIILIEGDVSIIKRIGQHMSKGEIRISGDVGMYAGAFMSGGKITIGGNAGTRAGQQMSGGELVIKGNAECYLGANVIGNWIGMTGGRIKVGGNVGEGVGEWMNGGLIEIKGNAGSFLGAHMQGGTIIVQGDVGNRTGAQMVGGNIVVMGKIERLLPGFRFEEEVKGIELENINLGGTFLKFMGDMAEKGRAKLYLSKEKNKHLPENLVK